MPRRNVDDTSKFRDKCNESLKSVGRGRTCSRTCSRTCICGVNRPPMHAVSTANPAHPSIQPTQSIHPIQTYSGVYRLCPARCFAVSTAVHAVTHAFAVSTAHPCMRCQPPNQPIHPSSPPSPSIPSRHTAVTTAFVPRGVYTAFVGLAVSTAFWVDESDHFSLSIYVFRQLADHHQRFFCHHVSLS